MTKFIMLVGLPAAGKSAYAEGLLTHAGYDIEEGVIYGTNADGNPCYIVSSDNIRLAKGYTATETTKTFELMREFTVDALAKGISVIYDATNLSWKKRKGFLSQIAHLSVYTECVVFLTPFEVCLQRNAERERVVPESSMYSMLRAFTLPTELEGWNNIVPYRNTPPLYSLEDLLSKTQDFSQNNRHHRLSLYQHLVKTQEYIDRQPDTAFKYQMSIAALYHDIGKLYTKSYYNAKGIETNEAHYYGHENAGTYLFLTASKSLEIQAQEWHIAMLINWHMRPYVTMSEKKRKMEIAMLGQDFWNELTLLHKADKHAH